MLYDVFECTNCDWTEDMDYPMNSTDWYDFIKEHGESLNDTRTI